VPLNRNGRFRKVSPATFDRVLREAKKASYQSPASLRTSLSGWRKSVTQRFVM